MPGRGRTPGRRAADPVGGNPWHRPSAATGRGPARAGGPGLRPTGEPPPDRGNPRPRAVPPAGRPPKARHTFRHARTHLHHQHPRSGRGERPTRRYPALLPAARWHKFRPPSTQPTPTAPRNRGAQRAGGRAAGRTGEGNSHAECPHPRGDRAAGTGTGGRLRAHTARDDRGPGLPGLLGPLGPLTGRHAATIPTEPPQTAPRTAEAVPGAAGRSARPAQGTGRTDRRTSTGAGSQRPRLLSAVVQSVTMALRASSRPTLPLQTAFFSLVSTPSLPVAVWLP